MTYAPTFDQIDTYIAQMQASGVMGKSERRLRLLEHLIKAEATGEGDKLKAYSIGLDIFQKTEDFDPSTDSIVRVEIGRLRSAIQLFEASDFADTEIEVEIPVGTYRPNISRREIAPTGSHNSEAVAQSGGFSVKRYLLPIAAALVLCVGAVTYWMNSNAPEEVDIQQSIAIQLEDLEGEQEIGSGFARALRRALSRSESIMVLSEQDELAQRIKPDFTLRGAVTSLVDDEKRVDIELLNASTNRIVWAKALRVTSVSDLDQVVAGSVSDDLRVRMFGVTKDVLEGRDPETLTPQQLFVMATWVPGPAINAFTWELERVELMNMALERKPDFGQAHSVMADKLAYLANVYGPSNTKELREKAVWHAQRALELAPANADVMFNVAQSQWHGGMIKASQASMNRVLELDNNHDLARYLAMVIPYSCAVAPDDILARAIAFDEGLPPDSPIRWLTLTWIAWLHTHREEYEEALDAERRAALIFEIPYTFMRHAMLLNKLGRPDEAVAIIKRQQANWPDIDPNHFASVTVPRLCSENFEEKRFISNYEELSLAMDGRL